MENASLPVDVESVALSLNVAQERVADLPPGTTLSLVGPPASGKTTALAAHFLHLERQNQKALVICSHASGVQAFRAALAALRAAPAPSQVTFEHSATVAALSTHAAGWMRAAYAAARASPQLQVGTQTATRAIVQQAAHGLLSLSWPLFARRQLNLDLPHLSRPEAFLDEAASLFTLLQRARIGPEEFELGCAAGLAAFYGENVERAVVLLNDPLVRARASQRGREACRASALTLALQRAAERDVAAILAQLYREYLSAAASADVRSPEDIVDAAIRWLSHDEGSAQAIMQQYASIIIDDAEDGEPGLVALVSVLKNVSGCNLLVGGCERARVDGFEGRRSSLSLGDGGLRIELAPLNAIVPARFQRLTDEAEEVAWLAGQLAELLTLQERPEDVALLYRNEDTAAHYVRLLRAHGLPVALPPASFESEAELLDLLSLCAIVQDPFQAAHILRVLASPLLGLSDATLWQLCRDPAAVAQLALPVGEPGVSSHAGAGGVTLATNVFYGAADPLLNEEQRTTLLHFRDELARWRAAARGFSSAQLLAYIAAAGGFEEHWLRLPEYERLRRKQDVRRLIEAVGLLAAKTQASFADVADRFARAMLVVRPAERSPGAVNSDSIAGAKGQRWRHVFVAGVAHERFPRIYTSHAIAFSRTYGLIVRENVAKGAAQTAKYAWYYAKFGAKNMYLDEERRALHYGLSRAAAGATASGYGSPPRWARDHDLLATLLNGASEVEGPRK